MPKPLLHFLSYGRGYLQPQQYERDHPQPLCGEREFTQAQLTSNDRRVTCGRCLALMTQSYEPNPKRVQMKPETIARRVRERAASRIASSASLTRRLEDAVRKHGPDSIYAEMLAEHRKRSNPAEHREPAKDHIRNAMALLMTTQPYTQDGEPLTVLDVRMILDRLRKALNEIERVDIRLHNGRRGGSVRRGNPSLMVLGANPRVTDATLATWAKIEYTRPDDPDGKDVIRVHEFKDGFEIGWLDDGSVQLSHPRHPLWTEDEIGRA